MNIYFIVSNCCILIQQYPSYIRRSYKIKKLKSQYKRDKDKKIPRESQANSQYVYEMTLTLLIIKEMQINTTLATIISIRLAKIEEKDLCCPKLVRMWGNSHSHLL